MNKRLDPGKTIRSEFLGTIASTNVPDRVGLGWRKNRFLVTELFGPRRIEVC